MFPPRLLVVHDPTARRQDDVPKLSARQELDDPFLEIGDADVVARGDDAGFVDAPVELNDDLAGSVIVHFFEFTDIAYIHGGREGGGG